MSDKKGRHEPITFDPNRLETLRARLQGSVLIPGDEGYDMARQTWDVTTFDQHPAMIVLPAIASDVQAAVTFAREHDLPIAVQGGGHGHPYPADDALLVNFANMTNVYISAETATARIEPGVRSRAVIQAAHAYGLAPLTGFAATVGIVGYLLGGGCGWLTRQYGPGAASIRSVELVTADGNLLQVNASTHPDLFWGLRGGGGNFGIVTALECALYPVKEIFAGQVVYPIEQGKGVLNAYLQWAETVPDELTSALGITHFPTSPDLPPTLRGTSAMIIMACYNGEAAEGEALLSPKSGAFRAFTSNDIDTLLDIAGNPASGIFQVEIRQFGGALARQPEDAMAFNCRHAHLYLNVQATAPSPDQLEGGKQSIATMMQALQPAMTGETLINFLDAGNVGPDLTRAAYSPETYQRLRTLKDRYDAKNVFRFNHNIPPSSR